MTNIFLILILLISSAYSADLNHNFSEETHDYPPEDMAESMNSIKQEDISEDHLILPDGTILEKYLKLNAPELLNDINRKKDNNK